MCMVVEHTTGHGGGPCSLVGNFVVHSKVAESSHNKHALNALAVCSHRYILMHLPAVAEQCVWKSLGCSAQGCDQQG